MVDTQNDKFEPRNRTVIMELTRAILHCIQINCLKSELKETRLNLLSCFRLVFKCVCACSLYVFSMMTNLLKFQPAFKHSLVSNSHSTEIIREKYRKKFLCIKACNFKLRFSFQDKSGIKLQKQRMIVICRSVDMQQCFDLKHGKYFLIFNVR